MLRQTNSQYLKWLCGIENELSLLFRLFSPLCSDCFSLTIGQSERRERENRRFWCCCLIDNQVHDHWESLDAIQSRLDPKWYQKLKGNNSLSRIGRMPGNGPCSALGPSGCLIKKCRPITCGTQICEKMLYILSRTAVVDCLAVGPLQIEDIIDVPDILPELCGLRRGKQITERDVRKYREAIVELRQKLSVITKEERLSLVEESLSFYLKKGGLKK